MSRNLPAEKHILHLWTFPDVVHDHVPPARTIFLIYNDADVWHAATQIPGYEIARRIVLGTGG